MMIVSTVKSNRQDTQTIVNTYKLINAQKIKPTIIPSEAPIVRKSIRNAIRI